MCYVHPQILLGGLGALVAKPEGDLANIPSCLQDVQGAGVPKHVG